ncbi:MAG: hypothetical protein NWQ43_10120 [Dolichospermum sp.]|nr:hypothetical protein [Dolichospermum sp.]
MLNQYTPKCKHIFFKKCGSSFRSNFKTTPILHNLCVDCQEGILKKIKLLIGGHKLTETLEVLEKSGISGDFDLFVLGEIATVGVWR